MNAPAKIAPNPLGMLREPFAAHHISKLPKETKAQREEREKDRAKGVKCEVCGGWHHRNAVHLDYVGHAALTDRLLDADPFWSWEPVAFREGLPAFDATGGLWIKLTIAGVTRLGYGHAAAKPNMDPGAREKEVIGDALRNAAMRFGAALDLWHKGDLHPDSPEPAAADDEYLPIQGRKSSAQAKRDGDHTRINGIIDAADVAMLDEFEENFDALTADLPSGWLDPLRNRIILRREELAGAASIAEDEAALNEAFCASVGPADAPAMAGRGASGRQAA